MIFAVPGEPLFLEGLLDQFVLAGRAGKIEHKAKRNASGGWSIASVVL